ncbi:MAG: S8 family serine peptidase [Ferruginibacter sp.]|nr:S8 family serine peptidase [Ferruginibacter sp.]
MNKISKILLAALLTGSSALAQDGDSVKSISAPKNWHQLDLATSGFNGISLDKAYSLIKSKKLRSNRILVAVIDSGIDTLHEDLKPILWTNPKEIPGNGIDDDKNGYVDDVHGWNFIGGKDGRNVKEDSDEGARVYNKLRTKWDGKEVVSENLSPADKVEYNTYVRARDKVVGSVNKEEVAYLRQLFPSFLKGDSIIRKELGKDEYNGNDLKNFNPVNFDAIKIKSLVLGISKANNSYDITNSQLIDDIKGQLRKADAAGNAPKEYRKDIVGDDETNINDRFYGNNDIMASTPFHGTHCSGIIAAARNNGKGVDGIADNVRIMMLRAVPDGDEHDKDIAIAIRYAVDNGARIISMSFGKDFSPEKKWVDDAFKYAEIKGVLLVHAAGNDSKNIDSTDNFPNPVYINGKGRASNVITVGASGDIKNGGLTASFSNFGKNEVDVFAPGVSIYSTIPGDTTYGNASGTSMACPVVAGIAALILEHYPKLTPQQLKYAIEKSAGLPKEKVTKPGTDEKVELSDLSKTGGIVNAYEAVKLAGTLKTTKQKEVFPKMTIKKNKLG